MIFDSSLRFSNEIELEDFYGKKITNVILEEEVDEPYLQIMFEDKSELFIGEGENQCSEEKYMRCDDNVFNLTGQTLCSISIKVAEIESHPSDNYPIIKKFIEIRTPEGYISLKFHNEYSELYSGFDTVFKGELIENKEKTL